METIKDFITEIGNSNKYMLLSRMQSDCEYFLNWGNRSERRLWAGNVRDQIRFMRVLWLICPINEKPQWLSMNQILDFEKQINFNN